MRVKRRPVSIRSLRDAIAFLDHQPGQMIRTGTPVDPAAELSGVYRYVGAGGTVMRPTTVNGPAMLFESINGHPDTSVLIGLLASRSRVAAMLGCAKEDLGHLLCECVREPIAPVLMSAPAPRAGDRASGERSGF